MAYLIVFPGSYLLGCSNLTYYIARIKVINVRDKGGKGFASYFGMTLGLNWKYALILAAVIVAVTLIFDYIVLGTFTTITFSPIVLCLLSRSLILTLILLAASAVILYKHRENIVRLRNSTEIGLRSTAKGEHRIK